MSSSLYYLWSWLTIKVYYLQPKIWFEVYFELILNPGWLWNKLSTILGSRYANFWKIRRQFEWWKTHKRELKQTRRRSQRERHLKNVTFLQSFLNYWKSLYGQIFYELSWIKFAPALQRWDDKIENFFIMCSRRPCNCKTGHFTSWKERERLRNVQEWRMHVQSEQNYCFSSSSMQIWDVLVAVVFVVA